MPGDEDFDALYAELDRFVDRKKSEFEQDLEEIRRREEQAVKAAAAADLQAPRRPMLPVRAAKRVGSGVTRAVRWPGRVRSRRRAAAARKRAQPELPFDGSA